MYITVMTNKGSTVAKLAEPYYLMYGGIAEDGSIIWNNCHLSDDAVYMSLDEAEKLVEKLEEADEADLALIDKTYPDLVDIKLSYLRHGFAAWSATRQSRS